MLEKQMEYASLIEEHLRLMEVIGELAEDELERDDEYGEV